MISRKLLIVIICSTGTLLMILTSKMSFSLFAEGKGGWLKLTKLKLTFIKYKVIIICVILASVLTSPKRETENPQLTIGILTNNRLLNTDRKIEYNNLKSKKYFCPCIFLTSEKIFGKK